MELGELKVFVTVATEHSFSRAAVKLCRTQPAVSQAVRRLEEDLGELLFDRSTKSAKLTQAGDALLPQAIQLLRMADEAVATVRQLSQRDRAAVFPSRRAPRLLTQAARPSSRASGTCMLITIR